VDDKDRVFQGQHTGKTVDLLTLQALTKAPVCGFKTALVVILSEPHAGTTKVIVGKRARFPDTGILSRHKPLLSGRLRFTHITD
jgi:hypothetical protein